MWGSNLFPVRRHMLTGKRSLEGSLISALVTSTLSYRYLNFQEKWTYLGNRSFPIFRNNYPHNDLHKKDISFFTGGRRCLGWNLSKLLLSSLALWIISQQWCSLQELPWKKVTVTHRLNYTMYCDAIRKKDEMTKQISTRSSAGLCA